MDDSPMYDDAAYNSTTYTMNLDDVGLNSLYALDSECLAKIAEILGKEDDRKQFMDDYSRVKAAMQRYLWNEKDGIFENRYWDGRFSSRLSPTNFYPLLAGVATSEQAKSMVQEHLLNPKEFWGMYVIPTISRSDPAFKDQYYWRGDIWGPTNYLVYEGLNRYGYDATALQFAQKSYRLFMEDWRTNQHTNEQYYAWGGSAGGDKHYTWGALLCLIPMEQYLDQTPWGGFRFGALNPKESGRLTNIVWARHRYDITIGPNHTALERDGSVRFEADSGVVVRNYLPEPNGLTFSIKADRPIGIITRETDVARVSIRIDNQRSALLEVRQGAVNFKVSAGEHRVVETWK